MDSLLIKPAEGWVRINVREIWKYRELFYFLGIRDIKIRYKQTALGASWAVIQPLMTTIVFSFFFGRLAKIPSDGVPYTVFSYCALVPWTFFASSIGRGSASIVGNAHLITKIYFPRLVIPAAMLVPTLVDFSISFFTFIAVMFYYGMVPPLASIVTIPLLTIELTLFALGVSLWLGALNVYYRDVSHLVPFLTQLWMFCSPIAFPFSMIPVEYRSIASLNPIVGIIEGFRSALLGRPWLVQPLLTSVITTLVIFITGVFFFRRLESDFADLA